MDEQLKAALVAQFSGLQEQIKSWTEKANAEVADAKKLSTETKAAIEKLVGEANAVLDRVVALEQKAADRKVDIPGFVSLGESVIKSEQYRAFADRRFEGSMSQDMKAAIINATGQNQPLVPAQRQPGIITPPERAMTIRDLLIPGVTSSNLVEYVREDVFTNNAGYQPTEGTVKPESGITFTMASVAVATVAHFIPVSKQVLADAPALASYINGRMIYGLKLKEEAELLNGTGATGMLKGILHADNSVAFNRVVAGDTRVDRLRRAMTQVALSEYTADAVVMHPADWEAVELLKQTDNAYLLADPSSGLMTPRLWGRKVVATQAMTEGSFLVGAFAVAAQLFDREESNIAISEHHADNFTRNMLTIRAEERLALAVYRPAAFVRGTFV